MCIGLWLLALAALAIASEESAGMDNALNAGGGGGYSMSNRYPGGPDPSSGEGGPEFNQSDPASKALKAKLKQAKSIGCCGRRQGKSGRCSHH